MSNAMQARIDRIVDRARKAGGHVEMTVMETTVPRNINDPSSVKRDSYTCRLTIVDRNGVTKAILPTTYNLHKD
mgnify:CR=1 FL=1